MLKIGEADVFPDQDLIRCNGAAIAVTRRSMDVLVYLAKRPDTTISAEELLQAIWANEYIADNAVHKAISEVRHALGDDHQNPRFIRTVRNRGYRLIAPVSDTVASAESNPKSRSRTLVFTALVVAVFAAVTVVLWQIVDIEDLAKGFQRGTAPNHSLAVLRFDNVANDPEQDFFVDGIHAALTNNLAQISALHVISSTSVMAYENANKTSSQIGSDLNVQVLVEGSVFRTDDQVHISVQLIDAASDRLVWADSYEGPARDVLSLQNDVARAVAREVRARLTSSEEERLGNAQTVNPDAYDAFLKGVYHAASYQQGSAELASLWKSIEYYQEAIRLEPEWGMAHAGLAGAYHWLASEHGLRNNPDLWEKSKSEVLTALELDDKLAQAHASLGFVLHNYDWDWHGAEQAYQRALELDPSLTWGYALFLLSAARYGEAITNFKHTEARNPNSLIVKTQLGFAYMCAGRLDEAEAQLRQVLELAPDFLYAHLALGYLLMSKSMNDEGVAIIENAVGPPTEAALQMLPHLGYAYARIGRTTEALAVLHELKTKKVGFLPGLAELYIALGQSEKAIQLYEAAVEDRDRRVLDARCTPAYQILERHPRFQKVLHQVGFPLVRR